MSKSKKVKVRSNGRERHRDVPVGEWVDVPTGMMAAPDTYVDAEGVLRSSGDDSCVVWHNTGCSKRGIHPSEIVYDPETQAPWCPKCWQFKEIQNLLGTSNATLTN